jgi:DNA-binding response OmpR family regulator
MTDAAPRILIVEDELLVAMDLEATLTENGWRVIGPVSDVPRAIAMIDAETPDAVCLDMNLSGNSSAPIAQHLQARRIPFVVVSGYSERNVSDPAFDGAPLVQKPFMSEVLIDTIAGILPSCGADT